MSKITRRTLIRNGGITASMATLTPAGLPEVAAREDVGGSVFHVFAFQWKPDTSAAQKEKAAREIAAFQGQIPGLLQTHVGPNISPRGRGYTFGGIMQFKDKAALDAYVQHPAHQSSTPGVALTADRCNRIRSSRLIKIWQNLSDFCRFHAVVS